MPKVIAHVSVQLLGDKASSRGRSIELARAFIPRIGARMSERVVPTPMIRELTGIGDPNELMSLRGRAREGNRWAPVGYSSERWSCYEG